MTGAEPLLVAEAVTVGFEGILALDGVSLEVRPDEILGLIGPNGAGKTTLMNVLSGFQRVTSGRVVRAGRDATRWGPPRVARSGVARTFQSVRPFPALTVQENVEIGALGVGARRATARHRTDEILDALSLTARRDHAAGSLPLGEARRLGIARALASAPVALLLDEPAAGSNERESEQLVDALCAVRARFGCSLVVIEHDMALIMSICERIHVLDHGKTIAEGAPYEVRHDPAVLEAYLGHHLAGSHAPG